MSRDPLATPATPSELVPTPFTVDTYPNCVPPPGASVTTPFAVLVPQVPTHV